MKYFSFATFGLGQRYKELGRSAKFLLVLLLGSGLWGGCSGDGRYIPDVSGIEAPFRLVRFERDFFAMDSTRMPESLQKLYQSSPEFAPIFVEQILGGAMSGDTVANTRAFLSYPYSRRLYDTVELVYGNASGLERQLAQLAKYYRYYFPDDSTPISAVYTYISMYKYGIVVMDDYVAVGLDFFLGEQHADYAGIENLRHAYVRRTLTPEHLPAQVAYALADDILENEMQRPGYKLIDYMLHNGKKFYLSRLLQPELPDSLHFKFSDFQLQYCRNGEAGLYEHLNKEIGLYSDKLEKFRAYVFEGPFNPETGLYANSASWLGCQIVEQYADRLRREAKQKNPEQSARDRDVEVLHGVLAQTDPQEFLKRYKPKR